MVDANKITLPDVKKRRFTESDFKAVEDMINAEIKARKADPFRVDAEMTWQEVDRQIRLKPIEPVTEAGNDPDEDWHNAIEMGDLSRASEIIAADVMRLAFPDDRSFFEVHGDFRKKRFPGSQDEAKDKARFQKNQDRKIRSYMAQQQKDFGFKQRFKLSVKESLHHGGYVAEVGNETMTLFHEGGGIENATAPTWQPYSMWNAFPDPSASVHSTNLFYTGSMLLRKFEKFELITRQSNLMRIDKIKPKKNVIRFGDTDVVTKDVEVFKWLGPITIPRKKGEDIFIPNVIAIMANGTLVKLVPNDAPFTPVIYDGYERQDVQDPYFTSPLMKSSPLQTFNSRAANKFLDSVDLKTEPPITYNINAPEAADGGAPTIAPRTATPVTTQSDVQVLDVGDPQSALAGLRWGIDQMNQNLGSDANRAGVSPDVQQTATEIRNNSQRGEVRTIDFLGDLEDGGLKPYLYLSHYFNKKKGSPYEFYNDAPGQEDFATMAPKTDELPTKAHFDIVGSKGVLGEERRADGMLQVTQLLLGHEKTAELPNVTEIAKIAYQDVGVKRPETVLNIVTDEQQDEVDARVLELEVELQATTEAAQETQTQLQEQAAMAEQKVAEAEQKVRVIELEKREADVREQEQRLVAEGLRNQIGGLKVEAKINKLRTLAKDELIKITEETRELGGAETAPNATAGDQTPLAEQ